MHDLPLKLIAIATLVAWAVIGGTWRRGSLALAAGWVAGEVWYQATGQDMPIALYLVLDPLVIAAFWWHARGGWNWLDIGIVALFPVEWVFYAQPPGEAVWQTLYYLTSLQLLLAGPWPQLQCARETYSHGSLKQNGAGV